MSNRLGKRERLARKRHKRTRVWSSDMGSDSEPSKVGLKHDLRRMRKFFAGHTGGALTTKTASLKGTAEIGVIPEGATPSTVHLQ